MIKDCHGDGSPDNVVRRTVPVTIRKKGEENIAYTGSQRNTGYLT